MVVLREIQLNYNLLIVVAAILIYPQDNGILIELELQVVPSTDAERLSIFFDLQQRNASYV